MTSVATCQPCTNAKDDGVIMTLSSRVDGEATSYNKKNWANQWFGRNGTRFFYGAQLIGNIGLLAWAIENKDIFTGITAVSNLARNAYGTLTKDNEKKNTVLMGWGALSNTVQALSVLNGNVLDATKLLNAGAGAFAALTYTLRFGAYYLRRSGRRKELKANQAMSELPIVKNTDPLRERLDKGSERFEGHKEGAKEITKSKKRRMRAYNLEKTASIFFVTRGFSQFAAGVQKGSETGMGTGFAFIVGALGMLKGDFSKSRNARERCFYANTESLIRSFNDGAANKYQKALDA